VKIAEGKRNAMAIRLIQERSRLVNLVKAIDRLAHEFRAIKDVSTRIELAIRSHKKTKLLTLHDLGVTSADVIEEEDEDDES
jgi:ribosomal protein S7